MKPPRDLERLSLMPPETGVSLGPYPPVGFMAVRDAELGNGDYFGLYWPLGREKDEPIVCDMMHDDWAMDLCFSSVSRFADWLEANDHSRSDEPIEDPDFAPALFQHAKIKIAEGSIPDAIPLLQNACSIFPEKSDYWFALAGQLRRTGRGEEAIQAALNAYTSNWSFGCPADGVLRMIQAGRNSSALANDPLVQRSASLTNKFGGDKENANYPLLLECAREYFERGDPLTALKMSQNHAFRMSGETVSFRERHEFSQEAWQQEFSNLCAKHLGDARRAIDNE